MELRAAFCRAFEVPPAMQPYVDLVANQREMELVVGLGGQALTGDEVDKCWGCGLCATSCPEGAITMEAL
jgi:NAD-dependent dihydropyrimidine dehydrogenase PreA subunit